MREVIVRSLFAPMAATVLCWQSPTDAKSINIRFDQLPRDEIKGDLRSFTDRNADRESELRRMFQQSGCTPDNLKEEPFKRKMPPNVICTLPGSSGSLIIVGAHTDHVKLGKGVVDDWSGAALLPALIKSLCNTPRKHTFVFIGFADEEGGLVGSHYYVRHLSRAQISDIRAMVNLECLGLTPTKVWADRANRQLLAALVIVARLFKLQLEGVNVDRVGDDDTHSFLRRKVPVITLHSVTQQTWSILHSPRDTLAAINFNDYYDSYRLVAAYLAYLDGALQ